MVANYTLEARILPCNHHWNAIAVCNPLPLPETLNIYTSYCIYYFYFHAYTKLARPLFPLMTFSCPCKYNAMFDFRVIQLAILQTRAECMEYDIRVSRLLALALIATLRVSALVDEVASSIKSTTASLVDRRITSKFHHNLDAKLSPEIGLILMEIMSCDRH